MLSRKRNIVMVYISIGVLTLTNILYTYVAIDKAVRDSEQKFCSVINTVNHAYAGQEPESEIGRELKVGYVVLAKELGCK